ncbi:hypothetical protein B566_EDAN015392 [Ephemera danica]|nr:hypothetical protein B566_EDAN015392 [Ephemera danica]
MASGVSIRLFRFQKMFRVSSLILGGERTYLSEAFKCQTTWDKRLEAPLIKKINLASILPSTPHSLIRAYLAAGHIDSLLRVLDDRLNYGVFLDHFTACLLLDSFIQNKQYLEAAKVGALQMLQEDWEHPLVVRLSILGCVHHLQDPKPWDSIGQSPQKQDEPTEEVKIRVRYLRNPFFDDHFDLQDGTLLVGKTLALLGPHLPDKSLAQSIELLGWVLYGKLEQAVDMALESLKATAGETTEAQKSLESLLTSASTSEGDLVALLEKTVLEAVSQFEAKDIETQERTYAQWEKVREQELVKQLTEIDRAERLKVIEEKKKYLQEKEERLYFFDKEHEWELKIEENQPRYKKRWFGKKKTKRVLDENYVPPEINRNSAKS